MERDPQREVAIRKRIGEVIAARCAIRGLSTEELAKVAGVDDRHMARALTGETGLSTYSLDRVARALGWTLGELMYVAFPPGPKARRVPAALRAARLLVRRPVVR